MPSLTVDLAGVATDLSTFPNGVYEAKVLDAELEISKNSGNPMITVEFEISHPDLGTGTIRDWLSPGFKSKIKSFWMAANGFSNEQARDALASGGEIELDPDEMKGLEILVVVGEQESREKDGRMFKRIIAPFFFPVTRMDLVQWGDDEVPV